MPEQPKISVVMPVYNSEKFVAKAIESVIQQTYSNWELVIVDDGSNDNSSMIVEGYLHDKRIRLLKNEKNSGISKTRNRAIMQASGVYIAFLDSDDVWLPDKLEKQVYFMKENEAVFICSSYFVADESGNIIGERNFDVNKWNYKELLKTNNIGCLTVMIEAKLLKANPMPEMKHEDYATWLNILRTGANVMVSSDKLAIYTKREDSISANKLNTVKWIWRIFHEGQNYSAVRSFFLLIRFLFYTTKKYAK